MKSRDFEPPQNVRANEENFNKRLIGKKTFLCNFLLVL